jgi:hypothetical protein
MFSGLVLSACVDLNNIEDIELVHSDAEYAIPLINSDITLESVMTYNLDNASVTYDEEGLAIVHYSADIIKKQANEIFKTIIFPEPLPFPDTVLQIRFDQEGDYNVEKGTIRGDSIRFGFTNTYEEVINVTAGIREASKNGEFFKHSFQIDPGESMVSMLYSLRGYDFISPNNHLSFYYDARTTDNQRVQLENAFFEFTYLVFDFIQGYLGKNVQDLSNNDIEVNIFDLWASGLLEFENPKIKVRLDNSFGFPVKAIINYITITNLAGEQIDLESTLFDDDIIFDYPDLDEIGEIKSSEFIFDKNNSNFGSAFNQKVTKVSFDVDALANPDEDENLIGFYTFDSYYLLNVTVELPMRFKAKDFLLFDILTMESLPDEIDLFETIEFKTFIKNKFAVDINAQFYFLDEAETVLDSLFIDGERSFPAGTVNNDGTVTPDPESDQPIFIEYDKERIDKFKTATKIAPQIRFSTEFDPDQWINITREQSLELKIGAKFKLN